MSAVVSDTRRTPGAKVQPVPIEAVRIGAGFWRGWLDRLYNVTLPTQHAQCEVTGRLDNIRRVSGRSDAPFRGRYYDESDVYKWLEAASWSLAGREDRALRALVDGLVDDIAAAQQPDGYLHTYFALERAGQRYTDLINMHELYCAGHLIQAGIAHHRATGTETLLDVAVRLADHVCAEFGPDARETADGHPEIELALVELARETGQRAYAERARFFLHQRGQQPPRLGGYRYLQDHEPPVEQRDIAGHAVRAIYLACGLADAGLELEDRDLWDAAGRLWHSAYATKAYVTGGLGAHHSGESFGAAFELPNRSSYAESCAAVAGVMWNWRLLAGTGEARYADWMETTLYNGVLAGLSLDGEHYFYVNPLSAAAGNTPGRHGSTAPAARPTWRACSRACPATSTACPSARSGCTTSRRAGWMPTCRGPADCHWRWTRTTRGRVRSGSPCAGRRRVRWSCGCACPAGATRPACGSRMTPNVRSRRGATRRCGGSGNRATRSLRQAGPRGKRAATAAHAAPSARQRPARRGESWAGGAGPRPADLLRRVPRPPWAGAGRLRAARRCARGGGSDRDDRLPGMTLLDTEAVVLEETHRGGPLYQTLAETGPPSTKRVPIRAVPYFAWANRGPSTMDVWLRRQEAGFS